MSTSEQGRPPPFPDADAPLMTWALWWAKQGVAVFPLGDRIEPGSLPPRTDDPSKKPRRACRECARRKRVEHVSPAACYKECGHRLCHGVLGATTDPELIRDWWAQYPEANIGGATGAISDLFVIDTDPDHIETDKITGKRVPIDGTVTLAGLIEHHGGQWNPTWEHVTGSGGAHHLFRGVSQRRRDGSRYPNSTSGPGPGVDIRTDGGYVVLPPSVQNKGPHRITAVRRRAPVPGWVLDALDHTKVPAPAVLSHNGHVDGSAVSDSARALVDSELTKLRAKTSGRNTALNTAAYTIGGVVAHPDAAITREEALSAMLDAATANGYVAKDGITEARATAESGLNAGLTRPLQPWPPNSRTRDLTDAEVAKLAEIEAIIREIYDHDQAMMDDLLSGEPALVRDLQLGDRSARSEISSNRVGPPEEHDAGTSGWERTDLGPILDGTYRRPEPGVLYRDDGVGLFYPGRVHQVIGEPESGKSWLALIAVAARLKDGQPVLYLDYESDAVEIVYRLRELGVDDAAIREHLDYRHPEVGVDQVATTFAELLATSYALVVVDGVTDALGTDGASVTDNDEVAAFIRKVPDRLARETGAAVILIDHVAKGQAAGSARFALGAQHKLGKVRGTSYLVEPRVVLAPGTRGELRILLGKDSAGGVRRHCPPPERVGARLQLAARLVIDARDPEHLQVALHAPCRDDATVEPPAEVGKRGQRYERRPEFMERVSRTLERSDESSMSSSAIRRGTTGKANQVDKAVEALVIEGYVHRIGRGLGKYHQLIRKFREDTDSGPSATPSDGVVTVAEGVLREAHS